MSRSYRADGKPGRVPGFFLAMILAGCGQTAEPPAEGSWPARLTIPGTLEDRDLDEASGIAASRRDDRLFWVHEDSGAKARIYAIDEFGKRRGRIKLEKADNDDWEDIASYVHDGKPMLLLADTGDNDARRKRVSLYVVAEPDLADDDRPELTPERRIDFRYPDGPRDAEAVAIDSSTNTALILTKRDLPPRLYGVPLDMDRDDPIVAEFLGTVDTLPRPGRRDVEFAPKTGSWHWQPTAMDIARDGSAMVILTYSAVYYYSRHETDDWLQTISRPPLRFDIRNIRDAEAIAFAADGRSLFLTVEKKHAPLVRIDLLGESPQ